MKLYSALNAGFVPAFINTNAGAKLYICATPIAESAMPALLAAFTAVLPANWLEIKGVGNLGETGTSTNILTFDTWDTDVIQKGKGINDAGSPDLEIARIQTNTGQIALRAAALDSLNYMFKLVKNDKITSGGTGSITYYAGIVTGPLRPNGRNEDFDLEIFKLGFNQREIIVAAT